MNIVNMLTITVASAVTLSVNLLTITVAFARLVFVCLCWSFTAQSTTRSCRSGQLIVTLFLLA